VGKLNFLEKGTHPDIAYATHQCARFSEDRRASHEDTVIWLCKYLLATNDDGIIYDPKRDQSIEVYADADFCGSWNKATAPQDISTAKYRTAHKDRGPASRHHDEANRKRSLLETQERYLWLLKVRSLLPHKSPSEGV
jgi:hypothetical protein